MTQLARREFLIWSATAVAAIGVPGIAAAKVDLTTSESLLAARAIFERFDSPQAGGTTSVVDVLDEFASRTPSLEGWIYRAPAGVLVAARSLCCTSPTRSLQAAGLARVTCSELAVRLGLPVATGVGATIQAPRIRLMSHLGDWRLAVALSNSSVSLRQAQESLSLRAGSAWRAPVL